jgi:hypothetical protein
MNKSLSPSIGCSVPPRAAALDPLDEARIDLEALGVQLVLLDPLRADRRERTRTDVQGQKPVLDSALVQTREQRGIEVQTGGRRRDRAGHARKYRLIALRVARVGNALDVRRQRRLAMLRDVIRDVAVERKLEQRVVARNDERPCAAGELYLGTDGGFVTRSDLRPEAPRSEDSLEQELDASAGRLPAEQPRRQHASVVQHEQVVGRKQLR